MSVKKQLSIIGLWCIVVLMLVLVVLFIKNKNSGDYYSEYGIRGVGTFLNPYKISSEEDLEIFSNIVNSGVTFEGQYIVQTCDIELLDSEKYLPIASDSNCFKGNYNGNGHSLYNVNIQADKAALFENMQGSLRNITIISGTISGDIVASFMINSNENEASVINCYNYAWLNGTTMVSGIANDISNGEIVFCKNYGNYSGNVYYSLCGGNAKDIVTIGKEELFVSSNFDGNIYELNGSLKEQARVINGYMAMNTASFCSNVRVDVIDNRFVLSSELLKKGTLDGIDGIGTKHNPYLIKTIEDFEVFKDLVNCGIDFYQCYWKQCADIDLSQFHNFDPIGIYGSNHYFWGYYDGSGYKIKKMVMTRDDNCGLFGQLAGTVMNLQLTDSYIEGACVGGIVSHSVGGTAPQIINCYSDAVVNGLVRSGVLVDNFEGGNVVLCIGKAIGDEILCSYSAKNIIESYLIGERGVDNASVPQLDGVETNILNSSLQDSNIGEHFNNYISNHFMIRNINHDRLCLWHENGRLELSNNRQGISLGIFLNYFTIIIAIIMTVAFYRLENKIVAKKRKVAIITRVPNANHKDIYLFVVYGLALSYILLNIVTNGLGINRLFYVALRDTFSDRIAMIESADMYASYRYTLVPSFYPPLNNFLYWIPSLLLGNSIKNRFAYNGTDIENDSFIIMLWMTYLVLLIIMLFSIIKNSIVDNSNTRKMLFAISFFLMGPVLYSIERGNSVLLAVFFSVLFFRYQEDKKPLFQELALIFLALATSIKLYPMLFFFMIITQGETIKNIILKFIRFVCYCFAINVLILIPYGGINTIISYINNVFIARGNTNTRQLTWQEGGIDFYNLFRMYYTSDVASSLRIILIGITLLSAFVVFFNAKDKYEQTIVLIVIICCFPIESYYYVLSFFIIPLIQIYNRRKLNVIDYIITVELIAIVGLCPYYFLNTEYRINGIISTVVMILLILTLDIKKSYELRSEFNKITCK